MAFRVFLDVSLLLIAWIEWRERLKLISDLLGARFFLSFFCLSFLFFIFFAFFTSFAFFFFNARAYKQPLSLSLGLRACAYSNFISFSFLTSIY